MIPHKSNQLDQGLWGEKDWVRLLKHSRGRQKGPGKVRPVPGQGEQETILAAEEHPGSLLAPEDAADASRLPAGGTLLGQDRGTRSLKCNIRCDLFWG
jgi:hypothetical protein